MTKRMGANFLQKAICRTVQALSLLGQYLIARFKHAMIVFVKFNSGPDTDMIFTRIGTVLAHVVFWLSLVRLSTALSIDFFSVNMESNRLMSRRYLFTDTSGAALTNELFLMIFLAVSLGVLCEISKKSGKSVDPAQH